MQKKSILKSSKGIISVYVGVCVVTFIIILIAIYMVAVSVRKNQITTLIKVKEIYEKDNTKIASIYEDQKRILLEKLDVGSTVIYSPSGAYNWQAKYCSSTKTETTDDVLLESATGKSFNISSWKVLSIDRVTGKIELVPSSPTSGTVYLGEAQGYNNAVKLLNDACSSLYGNTTKGIEARCINLEDIEKYMTEEAVSSAHSYQYETVIYGQKASEPYTSSKKYPVIYGEEIKSVINGEEKASGLNYYEQTRLIERSEGTSTTSDIGAITTATSIQPYNTYWYKNATYMSTAFRTHENGTNYYDIIMCKGESINYWLASRSNSTYPDYATFGVRYVDSGAVNGRGLFYSGGLGENYSRTLFPVITLNISNITYDADSGFIVK